VPICIKVIFRLKKVSQCPIKRNEQTTKEIRVSICKQLIFYLWKKENVSFIDETSLYFNFKHEYGWEKRGEKLSIRNLPRRKNLSIITAISCDGICLIPLC